MKADRAAVHPDFPALMLAFCLQVFLVPLLAGTCTLPLLEGVEYMLRQFSGTVPGTRVGALWEADALLLLPAGLAAGYVIHRRWPGATPTGLWLWTVPTGFVAWDSIMGGFSSRREWFDYFFAPAGGTEGLPRLFEIDPLLSLIG